MVISSKSDIKSIEFLTRNLDAKLRLFCNHYGGGSSNIFYPWSKSFSKDLELIAFELPGHGKNFSDPLLNNIREIVNTIFDDFCNLLDKPFVLFGHSMGAFISYELVKKLTKNSLTLPKMLIVSACRAPHLSLNRTPISHLPDNEFISGLKKFNGIPNAISNNKELLDLFLPILRADLLATENYKDTEESPLLNCDIVAFGGQNDQTTLEKDVKDWQKQTRRDFKYYSFQGDHFFIRSAQEQVLEVLNHELDLLV